MTDWCTPVDCVMAIARRDLCDELLKRVRRTARPNHDRTVSDRHIDGIALVELALKGSPESARLAARAMPHLGNALQATPKDIGTLEAQANALSILGRRDEALVVCDQILALAPSRELALVLAAQVSEGLGRSRAAVDYWKRALTVNPWMAPWHARRARLLSRQGAWPEAIDECQAALRIDPTLADALEKGRRKINYQIDGLRTRFNRSQIARDEAVRRQIEHAFDLLYPQKALQERHLNITSFIARHGLYFVDWIFDAIELESREHHIVFL